MDNFINGIQSTYANHTYTGSTNAIEDKLNNSDLSKMRNLWKFVRTLKVIL